MGARAKRNREGILSSRRTGGNCCKDKLEVTSFKEADHDLEELEDCCRALLLHPGATTACL